jgi:hypothetical protein
MTGKHVQPLVLVLGGEGEARQIAATALQQHGYDILEADRVEAGLSSLRPSSNLCAVVVVLGDHDPLALRNRVHQAWPGAGLLFLVGDHANRIHHNGGWTELGMPAEPHQIAYAVANLIARE